MTLNTRKTNVTIIESKGVAYTNFEYHNIRLEEVTPYKFLRIYFNQNMKWSYSMEKRINEGGKLTLVLKTIVRWKTSSCGIKGNSSLRLSSLSLPYVGVNFWVVEYPKSRGNGSSKSGSAL